MGDEHFAHALARHNFYDDDFDYYRRGATYREKCDKITYSTKSPSANDPESSLRYCVCNNAPNLAVLR